MNYKEIVALEARLKSIIEEAVSDITNSVKSSEIPGVKRISDNPICFSIKLSDLGKSWSPEYYSSVSQAELVRTYLQGSSTVTSLRNKLSQLSEDGFVIVKSQRHPLNSVTLEIINKVYSELFEA